MMRRNDHVVPPYVFAAPGPSRAGSGGEYVRGVLHAHQVIPGPEQALKLLTVYF